jgi:hypothetical protein
LNIDISYRVRGYAMTSKVTNISGIGSATATILSEHKFKTVISIAQTTVEKLSAVPGFSTARASNAIDAAKQLLAATTSSSDAGADTSKNASSSNAKSTKRQKEKNKKAKGKKKKGKKKKGKKNKDGAKDKKKSGKNKSRDKKKNKSKNKKNNKQNRKK